MSSNVTSRFRFGVFEVDLASGDLRKQGVRTRVHGKPFEVLAALLERPGIVVRRKELQERLWPGDTYVEFENGLNNAISRLREALGDSADSPRFIETVPRRGYRFIAFVEALDDHTRPDSTDRKEAVAADSGRWPRYSMVLVLVLLAAAGGWWYLAGRPPEPSLQSIAVLPFVTSSPESGSSDEYVAFGMTEALTTELSQTNALKVISQTSALRYRNTGKGLPEIARELGVGAIVEGSVVREGEHVRITVQLIDAASDIHLWAETYRREAADILSAQDELARLAATNIRAQLTNETPPPMRSPDATDPAVREAHLKGRYFMSLGTEAGRTEALAFFEKALALDPGHAPSHAGAADYYILTDGMPPDVAIPRAKEHAQRALAIDETSADAHATLGFLHYYGEWDWPDAERHLQRALELNPGHSRARRWYAMYLAAMGRRDEAEEQIERVLELDPVSIQALDSAGQVWFHTRQAERVFEVSRRLLQLSPASPQGYEHLVGAHVLNRDYERALEAVRQGVRVSGREPLFLALQAQIEGALGHDEDLRKTLDEIAIAADERFVTPFFLAIAHAGREERTTALDWLEKGFASRDGYLVFLKASPWMDAVRAEPRFQELLKKLRFPV